MSDNDGMNSSTRVHAVRCAWASAVMSYRHKHLMLPLLETPALVVPIWCREPPRVRNVLPRAPGSHILRSGGGISRGMSDILRVGIWCAITLISSLFVAVLWLATASLDPFEDLAHGGLCDLV
jgi:hypothetical protein